MAYTLFIGNKNYSSWSLRPWLVMRQGGIPFQEELVSLQDDPGKAARFGRLPAGRVPVLADGDVLVWDSLAICEYLAERHPGLWPADPEARAWARCISAEMHSGFMDLRQEMSMDVRARRPQRKRTDGVMRDIVRVERIWTDTRNRFGDRGELLFGTFTIADAFYAPVAFRFRTYGVKPSGVAGEYLAALLALPAMQEWEGASAGEERLADHELDVLYPDD
jgi:glutathione S-transferase